MSSLQMRGMSHRYAISFSIRTDIGGLGRFCIDNGIMIAHAGLLSYRMGFETPIEKSTCTQR